MTNLHEIYKCEICGNITEVLHTGVGELVCCGQPMKLQIANTVDAALEKHVPVVEQTETGALIKVGSEPHPMTDEHYIEWIEYVCPHTGKRIRKMLKPGDKPELEAMVTDIDNLKVRAYCNLHGLWANK